MLYRGAGGGTFILCAGNVTYAIKVVRTGVTSRRRLARFNYT